MVLLCDCNQCPLFSLKIKTTKFTSIPQLSHGKYEFLHWITHLKHMCLANREYKCVILQYTETLPACRFGYRPGIVCRFHATSKILFRHTHINIHPPLYQHQHATEGMCRTWKNNRGGEKECSEESVPEDSRWGLSITLYQSH